MSKSPLKFHYGNPSTEARAFGCVFDLLTNNWMPEYCPDPVTNAEYRAWVLDSYRQLGAWAYFHDEKAENRAASEKELSDLVGTPVYTTTENHLAHCNMLSRQMHRLVPGKIRQNCRRCSQYRCAHDALYFGYSQSYWLHRAVSYSASWIYV
jgi:hypothetical protein